MGGEKSLKNVKLAFLFGVGVLILLALYLNLKNNPIDKENVNEMLDSDELIEDVGELDELDIAEIEEKYKKSEDDDLSSVYEKTDELKDDKYIVENSEMKSEFIKIHGEKAMNRVNEIGSRLIELYLEDNFNFNEWKGLITKHEFEEVKNNKDNQLIKDISRSDNIEYETHFVAVTEEELVVEIELIWSDSIEGVGSSGDQVNVVYFVFDMKDDDKKAVSMIVI